MVNYLGTLLFNLFDFRTRRFFLGALLHESAQSKNDGIKKEAFPMRHSSNLSHKLQSRLMLHPVRQAELV